MQPSFEPGAMRQRLAEERARLLAWIESLQRNMTAIRDTSTWTSTDDEHDPEGATIAYERAQVRSFLDDAHRDLEALERAGARVDAGTYGACERCGKAIAPERLAALPAAATCIACATRR